MKQSRAIKLAYAAGFLDGDGCIKIARRLPKNGRSLNHSLLVLIAQKDGRPLDWFYGIWGGTVCLKNKKKDGTDWIYEWRLADDKAYHFLREILPFLIYKKEQAQIAIRFNERRIHGRNNFDGRFQPLTDREIEIREQMYQEISRIKHSFVKSKNPNVREYTFKSMVQD